MGAYDQLYDDPEYLKALMAARQSQQSLYQYPQSTQYAPQGGNGLNKGIGIAGTAMQAAAPMAQILLSRQRPRPQMPSPVVAGSRGSPFQASSPYQVGRQQPEQRQSMLIRYLLGR